MLLDGFKINECDKCVYVKSTDKGYIIVWLYVDDMLIIGNNNDMIKSKKKMLNKKLDMKDLGVADVILRIKITRTFEGYALSQSHYVEEILEKFGKHDDRPTKTPVDISLHLSKKYRCRHITIRVLSNNRKLNVLNELH